MAPRDMGARTPEGGMPAIGGRYRWLVTGAAGFIGSNLVEALLRSGQQVIGLDNFATGHRRNVDDVRSAVGEADSARYRFIEGDIRDSHCCQEACAGVDFVLHQAALGSVPRSIAQPLATHVSNVDGFVNMLDAARMSGVKRFVYASSSSVYGDHPGLPKIEASIGKPLSPYAATKLVDEIYADVFARTYGMRCAGLRYFNVFGPRQDPAGAYAAVIPRWIAAMLRGDPVYINGDGETSRDFCYVANAVQANLRAALFPESSGDSTPSHEVFNVACGERLSLNELFIAIRDRLAASTPRVRDVSPNYRDFREGDVRHSLADVSKARALLGYVPTHRVAAGLDEALDWYVKSLA
ncbi:MAG: NAD-dependent epimerase [Alphaproteobacteria bacterium]|nr:MAG: NAD-dependent epimerase [Alphaproteobacteria bacterium]